MLDLKKEIHIKDIESLEDFKNEVKSLLGTCELRNQWCVGGRSGGSCWDEGSPDYYSISADDEPEDEYLDEILEAFCPDITFLQYKRLLKNGLYEVKEWTQSEYYGNYYEYKSKTLALNVLFDGLKSIYE